MRASSSTHGNDAPTQLAPAPFPRTVPRSFLAAMVTVSACLGLHSRVRAAPQEVRLQYVSRYSHEEFNHDHQTGVEKIWGSYALVSSSLALALIDVEALTVDGTNQVVDRLEGVDVYTTVTREDGYAYANLRMGGLAVIFIDPMDLTITLIREIAEAGVYFEKMCVDGDRLYVAAHGYGMRIYDLTDPASPQLIGGLTDGFDDAFAVAVSGQTAYVADGAGGLKIVDVSNPSLSVIVGGETPASSSGTAEDVLIRGDHVYVASGGAGVAVYTIGDIESRAIYDTPVCAKHLALVGRHLAVADIGGVELFEIAPDGSLAHVAGESGRRRSWGGTDVSLRLWHGVAGWEDDKILTANWDSTDVYEIVDAAVGTQADLTISRDRLRFAPDGGAIIVELKNEGCETLQVSNMYVTQPTFWLSATQATLEPAESLDLIVSYAGGQPGSAMLMIESNDPDEDPAPIQLYGDTEYLDPTEPAPTFTLESWTMDHQSHEYHYDTFDLSSCNGKIVFFHVFGVG